MKTLAELVKDGTGTSPLDCYQCGRCSAGCPQNVAEGMEMGPTHIMRLIQMESAMADQDEIASEYCSRVLTSDTPWICAGCVACTQRCPQGIDIAQTMDVLRQEALRREQTSKSKRVRDVISLHKSFIAGIERSGRTNEVALVAEYKMRTGNLFADVLLAPAMFMNGKLDLNVFKSEDGIDLVLQAAKSLKEDHQ